jgi:hypothetical protein
VSNIIDLDSEQFFLYRTENTADTNYPKGKLTKCRVYRQHDDTTREHFLYKAAWSHKETHIPYQLWSEVIAYHVAKILNLSAPETFIGITTDPNAFQGIQCGVLSRWFKQPEENWISGAELLKNNTPNYDMTSDKHCYLDKVLTLTKDIEQHEACFLQMFLFDALIANADRHHENWEIKLQDDRKTPELLSPFFDNGVSLGFREKEDMLDLVVPEPYFRKFQYKFKRSCEPRRWLKATTAISFFKEQMGLQNFSKVTETFFECYNSDDVATTLDLCFDSSATSSLPSEFKLSRKRADWIVKFLNYRCSLIQELCEQA